MAAFSSRQWLAILTGTLIFTGLFFVNRKAPPKANDLAPQAGRANKGMSFEQVLNDALAAVPENQKEAIKKLDDALSKAKTEEQVSILNSIIGIYDSTGNQLPATYYMEKVAEKQKAPGLWYKAGERYYRAAQLVRQEAHDAVLQRALDCYSKSVALDSTNADAIVGVGECYVQQGSNPMQGIKMIESVIRKDSNNEKAQIALGTFSIQSAQYPKAIYRFNRVLKIDPSYIDAYLYLAETYEGMNNKTEAISNLEKYTTFVRDTAVKNQVNSYIRKLKGDTIKSNNNLKQS